jgi:hypothetical protein
MVYTKCPDCGRTIKSRGARIEPCPFCEVAHERVRARAAQARHTRAESSPRAWPPDDERDEPAAGDDDVGRALGYS